MSLLCVASALGLSQPVYTIYSQVERTDSCQPSRGMRPCLKWAWLRTAISNTISGYQLAYDQRDRPLSATPASRALFAGVPATPNLAIVFFGGQCHCKDVQGMSEPPASSSCHPLATGVTALGGLSLLAGALLSGRVP